MTLDWSPLAIATVVLSCVAVWSILQTRNIQRREYRHRFLTDIIKWAIDIVNWRSESKKIFKEMASTTDSKQQQLLIHAHIVEVKESFVGMGGRNQYIHNMAGKLTKVLQEVVEMLIANLEGYIEFLDNWQHILAEEIAKNVIDNNEYKYYDEADKLASQIDESARKVIEEAVKLKTKDVG